MAEPHEIKEELERLFPGQSGPLRPTEGYPYELETYSIVWYKIPDFSSDWTLALVLDPVPVKPSQRTCKREWHGLTRVWWIPKTLEKTQVHLCPEDGNAKPDTPYTRALLKLSGMLPDDDAFAQNWIIGAIGIGPSHSHTPGRTLEQDSNAYPLVTRFDSDHHLLDTLSAAREIADMGQFYDSCPQNLLDWIRKQHIFFVATAPLSPESHVNVSPKGAYDCFHIIGPNKVWYEDLSGSGTETIAHLRENKRITIMFLAFEGPPRIVRLFGTGTVYEFGTPEYEELIPKETRKPGSRSVIMVDVHKVGSSCGYAVPYYDYKGDRTQLLEFYHRLESKTDPNAENPRTDKGLREYWATKNLQSIDGLPGVIRALDSDKIPSNNWSKEEEKKKSQERVKLHYAQSQVFGNGNAVPNGHAIHEKNSIVTNASMGHKLVAAFAMGVFATLLCARVARLTA